MSVFVAVIVRHDVQLPETFSLIRRRSVHLTAVQVERFAVQTVLPRAARLPHYVRPDQHHLSIRSGSGSEKVGARIGRLSSLLTLPLS